MRGFFGIGPNRSERDEAMSENNELGLNPEELEKAIDDALDECAIAEKKGSILTDGHYRLAIAQHSADAATRKAAREIVGRLDRQAEVYKKSGGVNLARGMRVARHIVESHVEAHLQCQSIQRPEKGKRVMVVGGGHLSLHKTIGDRLAEADLQPKKAPEGGSDGS